VFSFADDTAVVYSGTTYNDAVRKCESDLLKLNNWFRFHKICPNTKKTTITPYYYKKSSSQKFSVFWHLPNCKQTNCNCEKIEITPLIKYLGVLLNSNLNWEEHSLYLQAKLRKLNYLMYYVQKIIPPKIRRKIYLALYEPVLQYGVECWGGAADYILHPIQVLQKYAVRAMSGANRLDHTKPIFTEWKLLSLNNLHRRALASVVHRQISKGQVIPIAHHQYSLRQYQKYSLPKNWLNKKARRQVNFQVPKFTSTLPDHLLKNLGHPTFPKTLKQYLIENY
jgi:hypothetical protein